MGGYATHDCMNIPDLAGLGALADWQQTVLTNVAVLCLSPLDTSQQTQLCDGANPPYLQWSIRTCAVLSRPV